MGGGGGGGVQYEGYKGRVNASIANVPGTATLLNGPEVANSFSKKSLEDFWG